MLSCVIISMTCGYQWLPPFVGRLGWGASLVLALFATLCGSLEGWWEAPNLSCARSHERGGLSRAEGRLWYSLLSQSSDREGVDCHGETSVLRASPHTLPRCVCW